MPKDIYTTQRKLNEILGIGGIEPSITNDYLNEAHGYPVPWRLAMFDISKVRFDNTGIPHTEATKKKISESQKKRLAKIGAHNKGVPHTEATKKKLREAHKHRTYNKDSKGRFTKWK